MGRSFHISMVPSYGLGHDRLEDPFQDGFLIHTFVGLHGAL